MDKQRQQEVLQMLEAKAPELLDRARAAADPLEAIVTAWLDLRRSSLWIEQYLRSQLAAQAGK